MKDFINKFLKENDLIFYYKDNKELIMSDIVTNNMFLTRDFMINIGNKKCYNDIQEELNRATLINGKDGFIYLYCKLYEHETKIVNTTIVWKTTNKYEKSYGKLLIKNIKENFHQGLIAEDEQYSCYNRYLEKYYWSNDILAVKDKLYKSGGVIKVSTVPQTPNDRSKKKR
ncbi:MAG: hypothetical protein LBI57_00460 [Helicobacteraceae bacterium]|nr:hypothetical protein [Helicobacteraceae bacterium]